MLLIAYGALHTDLPRYLSKGLPQRLLIAPLILGFAGLWWWRNARGQVFPHLADLLLAFPLLIDTLGLTFDWYSRYENFDGLAHFIGWFGIGASAALYFSAFGLTRRNVFLLAIGVGAITHILWEIFEYVSILTGSFHLEADYEDTMQDLILSLCGSISGTLFIIFALYDKGHVPAGMVLIPEEIVEARRKLRDG